MPSDMQSPTPNPQPQPAEYARPGSIQQNLQPGLIGAVCSIVAGVLGFIIPVLGIIGSGVGLWLGIKALKIGQMSKYNPTTICGVIGIAIAGLAIFYWILSIVFFGSMMSLISAGSRIR